ncbi:uncharacterized protein LOC143041351 [Oratosquilla oratoria]|uniref:uncharacterized protein LOC143041351 n=1 Tax=Oratosquilla oratoria TaxID=337810 RepID=UPI003F7685DD
METSKTLQAFLLIAHLISSGFADDGCKFNMKTYAAGETLMIFPEACMYLECIYFEPGDIEGQPGVPDEGYYIKVTILDRNDCDECCIHDGKLYGPGQWVHKSHDDCIRSTCINGNWVDKDETDTCCVYSDGFDDKFYVDGETIKIDDCLRIWCNASVVVEEDYECCCETDNEIYECGEFLPNPWGCIFEKCVDGTIVNVIIEGCCEHHGVTYMNGEIIGNGDDLCNYMRCVNGTVRLEHNDDCKLAAACKLFLFIITPSKETGLITEWLMNGLDLVALM